MKHISRSATTMAVLSLLASGSLVQVGCVRSHRASSPTVSSPVISPRTGAVDPAADEAVMAAARTDETFRAVDRHPVGFPPAHVPLDREAAPDRSPTLISLYGDELVGTLGNAATPFDGSANTRQVSFATEGATFDPHVDPTGKTIVFASTRHRATADIYLKATDGTSVTQLTSDPAHDIMPALDPGGQLVAFASNRSGNWDIHYQPLVGGPPVRLTFDEDPELHPTWSPDGKLIAYCKFGRRTGRWEIWVADVANPSTPSFLTFGVFPEWSPDVAVNKILFQRARQRGSYYHSVWTIDFVNGEARRPTEIISAGNAALINPSWSPDGRRIVFVSVVDPEDQPQRQPTYSDVWSINLDGTRRINLTNGRFANYQPVWARNGTIYFVSNRSGIDNIWAVSSSPSADSGPSTVVTVDPDASGPGGQP